MQNYGLSTSPAHTAQAQLTKSRANHTGLPGTPVRILTHSNSQLDNSQEIAEAFGRLFASSLTSDIKFLT